MDECCDSASCKQLEQFLLLAKTAKGQAAVELITRALEAPGVYVFGELLDSPNIKEVCSHLMGMWHDFPGTVVINWSTQSVLPAAGIVYVWYFC